MKRLFPSPHFRLLVLSIGVVILLIDAFMYYGRPVVNPQPFVPVVQTSPTPLPKTAPTQSRITSFNLLKTVDAEQIATAQKSFVGRSSPTAVSEIAVYRLRYDILGRDGSWKPITADIYIPVQMGSYPLFVFGAGTTGITAKCAPSLENVEIENMGNYDHQMIAQAAVGYVAVLPDYEGFHSNDNVETTQAYFVSESEAKTLLGSIRGLLELQSKAPALQVADLDNVFLAGYSQGGHAALSAAANWQELPSSVKLKGIIQFAGAADVQALFLESPWLASYLVGSYSRYYNPELNPTLVLQNRWIEALSRNNDVLCVNDAYQYFPHAPKEIYAPAFLDSIETKTWPANLAPWQKVIQQNTPTTGLPDVPYLSIQGALDPIVTAQTQVANVEALCAQDKDVTYREYAGVNHFQIRQVSFGVSNDWMKNILSGQTSYNTCAK
jgi:predicted esterase